MSTPSLAAIVPGHGGKHGALSETPSGLVCLSIFRQRARCTARRSQSRERRGFEAVASRSCSAGGLLLYGAGPRVLECCRLRAESMTGRSESHRDRLQTSAAFAANTQTGLSRGRVLVRRRATGLHASDVVPKATEHRHLMDPTGTDDERRDTAIVTSETEPTDNPDDQTYARRLVPESEGDLVSLLAGPGRGEALVLGEAVPLPTRVQFERPNPAPHSDNVDFYARWTSGPEIWTWIKLSGAGAARNAKCDGEAPCDEWFPCSGCARRERRLRRPTRRDGTCGCSSPST